MIDNLATLQKGIGVIGGVGPYAGLDFIQKIYGLTPARRDQDHVNITMIAEPASIVDRTEFLLGHTEINPGKALAAIAQRLAVDVSLIAIPCNTAHADPIFSCLRSVLEGSSVRLMHMIDETIKHIQTAYPGASRVGVLSTQGTYDVGVYSVALEKSGLTSVVLDRDAHDYYVHQAIVDPEFGIKACSSTVSDQAIERLHYAMDRLSERGVDAIVLGCTELPLAIMTGTYREIPLVDPTQVLAAACLREIGVLSRGG